LFVAAESYLTPTGAGRPPTPFGVAGPLTFGSGGPTTFGCFEPSLEELEHPMRLDAPKQMKQTKSRHAIR
jgi:hypothetical protein